MPNLPFSVYPAHVDLEPAETLQRNVAEVVVPQVIKSLTVTPPVAQKTVEPEPRDIIFRGSFDDVNEHFLTHNGRKGFPSFPRL